MIKFFRVNLKQNFIIYANRKYMLFQRTALSKNTETFIASEIEKLRDGQMTPDVAFTKQLHSPKNWQQDVNPLKRTRYEPNSKIQ